LTAKSGVIEPRSFVRKVDEGVKDLSFQREVVVNEPTFHSSKLRTSQMKVQRSLLEVAFGRRVEAAILAVPAMAATPRRE
jgi:hypothetical protein